MTDPARHVYSARRFRIVALLLTLVFLPIVIGASLLIYQYMRFSMMVEQRLRGERGSAPARVYARPLVLRPGLVLDAGGAAQGAERPALLGARRGRRRARPVRAHRGRDRRSSRGRSTAARASRCSSSSRPTRRASRGSRRSAASSSKRRFAELALEPELITYLFDEEREKRRRVRYEELPEHLVKAVLAIEDRRFFSHPGLDPIRLIGAVVRNVRTEREIPHGGSTITQQLCKNFFLTPERTLQAQGAGGAARVRARAARDEGGDPRAVPERDLPRPGGLVQHQRRGRGGADVLPQGRRQPDAARGRPCSPG